MIRRLCVLTVAWIVLVSLVATGSAGAQEGGTDDDDEVVEPGFYGDTELIETLRTYGLLDEWLAASPISTQASMLQVTGGGGYQAQRQVFLDSLDAWAKRTEAVRMEVARLDAAQAHTDRLRSAVIQVRDALVLDDRLSTDSNTLIEIESALGQLAIMQIPEHTPGESENPLVLAEIELHALWEVAEAELQALNGMEPAITSSGVGAFVGFDDLQVGLANVEQLIRRGREQVRPAREQSEQLVSSALAQIPSLHAARMLGSSDVGGLSVVTVDAYVRAAARASCSVDWALLAGIAQVESNHGRIGGASVSRSGQVSTAILGPLLDGGASERELEDAPPVEDWWPAVAEAISAAQSTSQAVIESPVWGWLRSTDDSDKGNGFAVVVDSDGGQLDGNDQWDRAIGPMQFLPETWSKWATDGNGDGVSDPHNLYDAAAGAARFLCHLSATRGPSPSNFVLGYNSSTSYVRSVLSAAQGFRAKTLPAG